MRFKKYMCIAATAIGICDPSMAQSCYTPKSISWIGGSQAPTSQVVDGSLSKTGGSNAASYFQNCTERSLPTNGTQWLSFSFRTNNYFNNYFNGFYFQNSSIADHIPIFMRWNFTNPHTPQQQYIGRGLSIFKDFGPLGEFTDLQAGKAWVQTSSQSFPNNIPWQNLTGLRFVDNRTYNVVMQAAANGTAYTVTDTATGQIGQSYFSENPNTNLGTNTGFSIWVLCSPASTGRSDFLCDGMSYRVDITNLSTGWFN